jgi:plasmid stabilization system protein ParE
VSAYEIVILPEVEEEIEAAFLWYQARNPLAAKAFRAEAIDYIDGLAECGADWKKDGEGTYSCLLKRFPYTIFYEIEGKTVFVLAVGHQRREPGYWRPH